MSKTQAVDRYLVAFDIVAYGGKKDLHSLIDDVLSSMGTKPSKKLLNTTWFVWSDLGATALRNEIKRSIMHEIGKSLTERHLQVVVTRALVGKRNTARFHP